MMLRSKLKINRRILDWRYYHSYPDRNEKPVITTSKSNVEKTVDKKALGVNLHQSFNLSKCFPGISHGKSLSSQAEFPQTVTTKLSNGLVVASQDFYSLMTSFAFVVKAGR
jgi:hypothetical protein